MARMNEEEKEYRKLLFQHLWHMHGEFRAIPGERSLTIEELEKIHEMMHVDKYACPPHEHKDKGPYDLGKIKLALGKGYIEMLRKEVRAQRSL